MRDHGEVPERLPARNTAALVFTEGDGNLVELQFVPQPSGGMEVRAETDGDSGAMLIDQDGMRALRDLLNALLGDGSA